MILGVSPLGDNQQKLDVSVIASSGPSLARTETAWEISLSTRLDVHSDETPSPGWPAGTRRTASVPPSTDERDSESMRDAVIIGRFTPINVTFDSSSFHISCSSSTPSALQRSSTRLASGPNAESLRGTPILQYGALPFRLQRSREEFLTSKNCSFLKLRLG